jgi:hypothetical protein
MGTDVCLLQNEEDAFAALAVMVDQLPQNYFSVRAGGPGAGDRGRGLGLGVPPTYISRSKLGFFSRSVCPRYP